MYFCYSVIISHWKRAWPYQQTLISCFLRRRFLFKFSQCIFAISLLSPFGNKRHPSFEQTKCFVPSFVKLALWLWRRGSFKFLNAFLLSRNYLHLGIGGIHHFNKLDSLPHTPPPLPQGKDAFCQVWLKLEHWFWRRFYKICQMYLHYFLIITPWKSAGPFI